MSARRVAARGTVQGLPFVLWDPSPEQLAALAKLGFELAGERPATPGELEQREAFWSRPSLAGWPGGRPLA